MQEDLAAFRAGDPDAVEAIYRRYAGAVHTVARSFIGADAELCADVVQQTFVKAWRAADTFEAGRDLAPWLYTIARRTAIDALRHERHPTRGGHAPEVDVVVGPPSLDDTWTVHEVRLAVDGLPPDERAVIRLTHLVGMTHTEVATRLGIPVGTVKSRSHRAIRRLGAALAHLTDAPVAKNQHDPSPVQESEHL